MSKQNQDNPNQAFTIVELLIVIVVIGILAAITIVAYNGIQSRAREAALQSDLRQASTHLELVHSDAGSYPSSSDDIPRSSETEYEYSTDQSSYCLTAHMSRRTQNTYYISSSSSAVQEGQCAGHSGGGAAEFKVGDTGPGGGIVFYDRGSYTDGWRYLESTTNDQTSAPWGCRGLSASYAANLEIGSGKQNTAEIIENCSGTTAASVADSYTQNGYSDWFLPSEGESAEMYQHRSTIGGFGGVFYWTSSNSTDVYARYRSFATGSPSQGDNGKQFSERVRVIRSF